MTFPMAHTITAVPGPSTPADESEAMGALYVTVQRWAKLALSVYHPYIAR